MGTMLHREPHDISASGLNTIPSFSHNMRLPHSYADLARSVTNEKSPFDGHQNRSRMARPACSALPPVRCSVDDRLGSYSPRSRSRTCVDPGSGKRTIGNRPCLAGDGRIQGSHRANHAGPVQCIGVASVQRRFGQAGWSRLRPMPSTSWT